jgi:hypothetical protein
MWGEKIVAVCIALSLHFPRGNKKNTKTQLREEYTNY